jgi:tripartite-type tricarboxylate transporter receptor subunit TctC
MNRFAGAALAAALLQLSPRAYAQCWPSKPIKLVAP